MSHNYLRERDYLRSLLATRRGRPAGFLRDRSGPIHDPRAHAEAPG